MMKKKYKFRLEEYHSHRPSKDLCKRLSIFENEWIRINRFGNIWIRPQYAWDGCTPSICILGLRWIGTPEGVINYKTGKPLTYYASLVHDALLQFKACPRKLADQIFYEILKEAGFELAWLYYAAVRFWAVITRQK